MFSKAEKVFAGALLIVCVIVGIAGFSFPGGSSPPSKVWFDASAGDVLFDHAYHATLAECYDCHHNLDEEDTAPEVENKCRDCHYHGEARELKSEDPTHPHFIGAKCVECHKSMDMETACDACHTRRGLAFEKSGLVMPTIPETVKFDTDNGLVNFDHKIHIGKDVGEPCISCHHECKEGKDMKGMACKKNCRTCHYEQADKIPECDDENHSRYIGANCAHCHDGDDCSQCHEE